MNILIVKLSSLGDILHAMPAIQDMRTALPGARIDWVVELGFLPLAARCDGVHRAIPCELRRWRKAPLTTATRTEWRAFRQDLQREAYDAVMDLQGLTKSGLVARLARLAPGGRRFAMANRTDDSSYEAPTRWLADVAVPVDPRSHAIQRSRDVCAAALGYTVPDQLRYGLERGVNDGERCVVLVHGTSREDKLWPEENWVAVGRRLLADGYVVALPQGSEEERVRAERIVQAIGPGAQLWPRLSLDRVIDRLATCAGAIGVDTGLSHIAVALDLPHVQVYNFKVSWRTGPLPAQRRQRAVHDDPTPSVDAVWQAWNVVRDAA